MATLFELTDDFMRLLDIMQDPDVDPEVIADTMEAIGGEWQDKVEAYCVVMQELKAQKAKWDEEKKRAEGFSKTIAGNIGRMETSVMASLRAVGKTKVETEHFKVSIQKNGGLAPVKITGEVPAEYCRLEPDNGKIREALTKGSLDFAELGERGVHLSVR